MNYFNKLGNYVKSAIDNRKTDEIEKGICSIQDMSSNNAPPQVDTTKSKTSMLAFFSQGKTAQSASTADNYKEIFSYNPNPTHTISNKKPPE